MKKRYLLTIALAFFVGLHGQAQNTPDSGFAPPQNLDLQNLEKSLTTYPTDFDNDGDLDILLADSELTSLIVWYENDGQGNFGEPKSLTSQYLAFPYVIYPSDLDGDGYPDIIVGNDFQLTGEILWYRNDRQGGVEAPRTITTLVIGPADLRTADLDGDGDQDVLSAFSFYENQTWLHRVAWYENDGQGNFGEQQIIASYDNEYSSVYPADIDGDGDLDVITAAEFSYRIAWYENDGLGNFGGRQTITTKVERPTSVTAADLDGDGDQDVLSSSFQDYKIAWYENDGQGKFGEQKLISKQAVRTRFATVADLDGDGDQDILSASDRLIAWYENDGQGSFGEQRAVARIDFNSDFIATADFDGDQDLDVLVDADGIYGYNNVAWVENLLSEIPPSTKPTVKSLKLFNALTDAEIQTLNNGDVINLLELMLRDFNIKADVDAAGHKIKRVNFDLEAPALQDTITNEFQVPYALYGDKKGDLRPHKAYAGDYELTATIYYQDSSSGKIMSTGKTVSFTFFARNLSARNLRVVDAQDNSEISVIRDYFQAKIYVSPNQPVSIVADSRFPQYNSIEFFLDGPTPDGIPEIKALENYAPYALFGNDASNTVLNGRPLKEGEYELRVIPYQGKNRDGYAGAEQVIRFTVIHETEDAQVLAYPVPFTSEVNLRTAGVDKDNLRIRFVHSYGQVYEVSPSQVIATEEGVRINVANLPAGPYTIQLQQADQVQTFRGSKE